MPLAYLSLGSNSGKREAWLALARKRLEEAGEILSASNIYETEPWGFHSQTSFLNQVLLLKTEWNPSRLLEFNLLVEKEAGRIRARSGYIARSLDIDILLYDDLILTSAELCIPHPRLADRLFVLKPLAELAPELPVPGTGNTVIALLNACRDDSWLEVYSGQE